MSYNEYKYVIELDRVPYAVALLESMYGNTDPYPHGTVNSLYYDTLSLAFFQQCTTVDVPVCRSSCGSKGCCSTGCCSKGCRSTGCCSKGCRSKGCRSKGCCSQGCSQVECPTTTTKSSNWIKLQFISSSTTERKVFVSSTTTEREVFFSSSPTTT